MDSRPWPEQFRVELHQQGLPASYIDRLVEELADHAVDSQMENKSMDAQQTFARIGTTTNLAATARHEFDRRTFVGRHPILTFVFGPIVFVPLLFALLTVGAIGLVWAIASAGDWIVGDTWPPLSTTAVTRWETWFIFCFEGYTRFIPFACAAWIFCRWGRRSGMPYWALGACGIVALMAGLVVEKTTPALGDLHGEWIIGFGFQPNLRQLLQLLAPLAIALCYLVLPLLLKHLKGTSAFSRLSRSPATNA